MCTVLLPPGGNSIAVKCIIPYHVLNYFWTAECFLNNYSNNTWLSQTFYNEPIQTLTVW